MSNTGWESARRVLCVRLDSLGDVLMTTPAIRAVKHSAPGRHVSLLTSPAGAELAGLLPDVDEVLAYEAPWMKATPPRRTPAEDLRMVARLEAGAFDAAVIFTVFSQNPLPAAMLCYLAGIPLRLAHCHENPYQLLTTHVPDDEPQQRIRHEVRRQLDLVARVDCRTRDERLRLRLPPEAAEDVRGLLEQHGLDERRPWLIIHPGASAASRRYPPARFARVASTLIQEHGLQLVFTGTASELDIIAAIRERLPGPSISLAGRLRLAQFAALVGMAPLLLSNNTGPVHVAAALGTPVVDLYALTNPQHTPWLVPSRILFYDVDCKYCFQSTCPMVHQDCLARVEPAAVVAAVTDLLDETNASPGGVASCGIAGTDGQER